MKQLFSACFALCMTSTAFSQANTKLSNLVSPTAVNQHLLPNSTNARDLGSSTYAWRNLYLRGELYLDGTRFVSNAPGTTAFNAFVGSNAGLAITTGKHNSALGHDALRLTTSGSGNTAIGRLALYSNTTGSKNVALGYKALYSSQANSGSVAIGDSALYKFNDFSYDDYMTAIGQRALTNNTLGYYNTAVGGQSLENNTTGAANTAVGTLSLYNTTTGSGNTALGYSAGVNSAILTNATAIGYYAYATASNQVMLGNENVTSVKAAGSFVLMSDGRFKTTPEENVPGLDFIRELRPVTYHYNISKLNAFLKQGRTKAAADSRGADEKLSRTEQQAIKAKEAKRYTGFVAQEVEQAAKKLNYEFSGVYTPQNEGDTYGLSYSDFVVPLVKSVQELDEKTKRIEELEKENSDIKSRLAKLEALLTNGSNPITLTSAYLEQNMPNPVSSTTNIRYHISETATSVRLTLTNAKGQVVKTVSLSNRGTGQVNLNTQGLAAGTYNYTLYVDGRQADTKRLVIAR